MTLKTWGSFWQWLFILFAMIIKDSIFTTFTWQMLTMLRFAAHVVVSILMGLLYWRVGDDAAVIYNNAGLLFFNQLFIMFAAMMPTIVTC